MGGGQMSKKSPPPEKVAGQEGRAMTPELEVERRAKIAETRRAYWASEEGRKVKEQMAKERTGRQSEVHRKAMADPENQRRRTEGIRKWAAQLGVVEAEEGPGPGWVTDEERAVAAREEERSAGA
jgi:hypothetical protein